VEPVLAKYSPAVDPEVLAFLARIPRSHSAIYRGAMGRRPDAPLLKL